MRFLIHASYFTLSANGRFLSSNCKNVLERSFFVLELQVTFFVILVIVIQRDQEAFTIIIVGEGSPLPPYGPTAIAVLYVGRRNASPTNVREIHIFY